MKLTLMIEGEASVIAMVLAGLPGGASVAATPVMPMPVMNPGADDDDDGPADASAPAVDSTGLPWDERIHAKSKATSGPDNAKVWRKRRNVADVTVAAVEAELRARGPVVAAPVPAPIAMPMVAMAPTMPAPLPVPVAAPVPLAPVAMAQPAVVAAPAYSPPPMPAPVAASPAAEGLDMATFMQHLSALMQRTDPTGAPLVHADYLMGVTNEISAAFAPHGVAALTAITDIAANPQMITYAAQVMARDGKW